jgi:lambda family phage portal protein
MALVDMHGVALPAAPRKALAPAPKRRVGAIRGDGNTSWDAASYTAPETASWNAWLGSPDVENNFTRDIVVSRIRDLVRNDGWASGAVTRILDSAVGGDLYPEPEPNWGYLSLLSPACDHVWADEFAAAASALWQNWAEDPGRYNDGGRRYTIPQLFRLAFRQKLVDGDALAVLLWLPERMGYGRAGYATALQLVDADRLSNPQLGIDTATRRNGVEIDRYGAAVAYHIRRAHQGDWFQAAKSVIWDRIERETDFGRPIVVHDFDSDRPAQHRGAGGIFLPILARMKMLSSFDAAELQAAVVNSVFAAYVESSGDVNSIQDALDTTDNVTPDPAPLTDSRLKVGDGRLPVLRPGEKIVAVDSKRPSSGYATFESAVLRNMAAALGMTAEQLSQDWSKVNYSSARAALLESWKTRERRLRDFGKGFCSPVYAAFLEEAMDRGELPLPATAPDFAEARGAYAACRWMGPPRGWIDPVKEAQAAVLRMDAGLSTLKQECAEQGLNWKKVVAQRAIERARFKELDLPEPRWFGQDLGENGGEGGSATDVAQKPEKPQAQ